MAKSKSMPKNSTSSRKNKSKSKSIQHNLTSGKKGEETSNSSRISRSMRADVIFPIGRITRYLRRGKYAKRIGGTAPVYLAGVLEYLVAEIIELSGNAAKVNERVRISPRDINLTILRDEEFSRLLYNVTIPRGGVVPYILEVLRPRPRK